MTTVAEWEAELAALRGDLGPTRPMQIRWFARHERVLRYPLLFYKRQDLRDEEQQIQWWEVAFYSAEPCPRDRPEAVVTVPGTTRFPIADRVIVQVGGRLDPGGAVGFVLPNGDTVFGITPARQPSLVRRQRW